MLDSVDVGVAINLGLYSGRTVGRTAVYFIRKLLRVGCRLRLCGEGKAWRLCLLRGRDRAREGIFVSVPAKAPAFALFCRERLFGYGWRIASNILNSTEK